MHDRVNDVALDGVTDVEQVSILNVRWQMHVNVSK